MKVSECVSFLLVDSNKVLLEKRAMSKATDPGLITIPGGHVEGNETREQALVRELQEELGLSPIKYTFLCTLYHPTAELQLIHYYIVDEWEGDIQTLEAEQVMWCNLNSKLPLGIDADKIALNEYTRLFKQINSLST
ncbi:NTP pyrophosphohydrolase [Photobacterium proteolyticum]|uniref:8-oxo-dGTP diphosphatase n=1 Tax=Photobacterium proteolyticum TaxID=1903952 RepID=A0A1Q9GFB3_9GAMM|nr:NUDIX domain-containing protein [Photobacterium proteolyticum]OLQ73138.1 NTP pyrophosphohydrolase [Photobacterium proteolyticum]